MNSEWKKKVTRNFDDCAQNYDHYSTVQSTVAQRLSDSLPDFEAPDVLEIGCGTGTLTQHLLDKYQSGRFHITDVSPQMLAHARQHIDCAKPIDWSVMDGEHPPTGRCYDLIIGNMVFQWFEESDDAFARLLHLLKPGGILLYSAPAPTCFKEWRSTLHDLSLSNGLLNFQILPGTFRTDDIIVQYESTLHFLQNLKKSGVHTPHNGYKKLSTTELMKSCRAADHKFQGKITWSILYGKLQMR